MVKGLHLNWCIQFSQGLETTALYSYGSAVLCNILLKNAEIAIPFAFVVFGPEYIIPKSKCIKAVAKVSESGNDITKPERQLAEFQGSTPLTYFFSSNP